ncbi:MAG: HEPN domain-containing protein [Gemmatimonadaceae bacterium]
MDVAEFQRWRTAADEARRAAVLQAGGDGHNWACFLAEQAAQLALKALLHEVGAGPWGHDLTASGRVAFVDSTWAGLRSAADG